MLSRRGRDDSPRSTGKPSRRRSPSPSDTDDEDLWPPRREFSPRGPAQRRHAREPFDDPPPRYSSPGSHSPPPRHRRSEPADPHRRHRRPRTADGRPEHSERRSRGRDDGRKQTWNPGYKEDRPEVDDYLPRRYRSTTGSPPHRRDRRPDRRSATYPEPPRERGYSSPRDYDSRPRPRHRDARDEKPRRRDASDEPPRRRRGRARSLDSDDRFRTRDTPRAKSHGARDPYPGKDKSAKSRLVKVAGDIPWGSLASSAFQAGASAAYKARADPGPWMGKKGTKVATAALGAAIVDTIGSGGKKRRH